MNPSFLKYLRYLALFSELESDLAAARVEVSLKVAPDCNVYEDQAVYIDNEGFVRRSF